MGVVYRATQLALQRSVALKAMAPALAQDDAFRERFQRESQLAASIDHPNVIPVYEAGESEGTLYLIMRWVDGTDLRAAGQGLGAGSSPSARSSSCARSPPRSPPPTAAVSCTATSSPPTSSSPAATARMTSTST